MPPRATPKLRGMKNAENTALLAEYALDFAILAADRALTSHP